jgi:hypothetical protein
MENLLETREVNVVCADNREYKRQASKLEIEQLKQSDYCNVKETKLGLTLDFRA